jgi:hypothetical protein
MSNSKAATLHSQQVLNAIKTSTLTRGRHESFFPIRPFNLSPLLGDDPFLVRARIVLERAHVPPAGRMKDKEASWGDFTQMYPGPPADMWNAWEARRRTRASTLSSNGFVLMDQTVDEMAEENRKLREQLREVRLALGARTRDNEADLVRTLKAELKQTGERVKLLEGELDAKCEREADLEIWDGPVVVR